MKTRYILFLLIALTSLPFHAFSQFNEEPQITKIKIVYRPVKKKKPVYEIKPGGTPPGTIKVKDYYVDQFEMTNIGWLEFLHYKKQELDSLAYQKLLPDSSNTWYTSRENRFAPLVLITYEQALEYCKWRSAFVSKNFNRKITYRLPTVEEWKEIAREELAANMKQNQKELTKALKQISKQPQNFLYLNTHKSKKGRVYHLFNNLTEMTAEKGVAIGANNMQLSDVPAENTKLYTYDSSGAYLGFRCIAEME